MKLSELLHGVQVLHSNVDLNTQIADIAYDSRKVQKGGLFAAITGFVTDGNRFIPMALEKGACAVLTSVKPEGDIPYILVPDDRLALAQVSVNYYADPASSMKVIGITGTNGKSSCVLLLKHVLEQTLGAKVGLIGTVGNFIGGKSLPAERTTPESLELQALFAQMKEQGCSYVVMEVSSHALALHRVGGIHFDVAAFTNLTEDHLDFHRTMENYCDTKAQLFARCDKGVANADDAYCARICAQKTCPILLTSAKGNGQLQAVNAQYLSNGVHFDAICGAQKVPVSLPIPGKFTVYNALTVLGCSMQLGISLEAAAKAMATAQGIPGRVEVVPTPGKPYTVLIDYAHTPDGLENVLCSVKDYCKGRLIALFGCGGDRDPMKRPIMGKIGTDIADVAVITSDNPRSEAPMDIIADILKGVDAKKNNYVVIENRVDAIGYAMDIAQKDDIIVLAGKGHETYQEICGVKHHLDEREVVKTFLQR